MKQFLWLVSAVALVFIVVSINSALYKVNEVDQVIITQFGKPVGEPDINAGIKLKIPFVQQVNSIEKRVLEWEGTPSDMPTKDKLYISVSLFARWQVTNLYNTFCVWAMSALRNPG
tara:strand:+ start:403 stop:750 length:348 start_codon:yes stop_codon:yes gene_type:complete